MRKYTLTTPEGTRDYLFEECENRRKTQNILSSVFQSHGFTEVMTPALEYLDVFSLENCGILSENMYKLVDTKGRILALRPDSTVPIARLVATRLKHEALPIRLFHSQSTFKINPSLSGKPNEELGCGIEIIGGAGKKADLEAVSIAIECLEECAPDHFRIEIGHIGIFNRIMEKSGFSPEEKEQIRQLIEDKNYPALSDILDLSDEGEEIHTLKHLPRLFGGDEVFDGAFALFSDPEIIEILNFLKGMYEDLKGLGLGDRISLDLGLVNRTGYYTGMVFKGYVSGFGDTVLSGGRYDNLLSEFGLHLPATGFGVNVNALSASLFKSTQIFKSRMIVYAEKGYEIKGLLTVKQLIRSGKIAEYSVFDSLEETKHYAKEKGIDEIYIVRGDADEAN